MVSEKLAVAAISLCFGVVLASAKLGIGLWIGSLALIGDSLHSTADLVAMGLSFLSVRLSERPADDNHPYGHGKYESLAALAESTLLLVTAGGLGVEAVSGLLNHAPSPPVGPLVFVVLITEIAVNGWRAFTLRAVAARTGSTALSGNAMHFASDMISTLAVLVGLIFAGFGFRLADPLAALVVALLIAAIAIRLMRKTLDELTDAVSPSVTRGLRREIAHVPGVVEVVGVKARQVGPQAFVEVQVNVRRSETLEQLPELKECIRAVITEVLPDAEATITAEPVPVDNETLRERIFLVAAREKLPVHHITLQHLDGRLSVGLDLEVPAQLTLQAAHDEATRLEEALRRELGPGVEVETHLEPLHGDPLAGEPVLGERRAALAADLARQAAACGIGDVHDIRVRRVGTGLIVAFHSAMPADTNIVECHRRLDSLEHALMQQWPDVARVISHPEPVDPRVAR